MATMETTPSTVVAESTTTDVPLVVQQQSTSVVASSSSSSSSYPPRGYSSSLSSKRMNDTTIIGDERLGNQQHDTEEVISVTDKSTKKSNAARFTDDNTERTNTETSTDTTVPIEESNSMSIIPTNCVRDGEERNMAQNPPVLSDNTAITTSPISNYSSSISSEQTNDVTIVRQSSFHKIQAAKFSPCEHEEEPITVQLQSLSSLSASPSNQSLSIRMKNFVITVPGQLWMVLQDAPMYIQSTIQHQRHRLLQFRLQHYYYYYSNNNKKNKNKSSVLYYRIPRQLRMVVHDMYIYILSILQDKLKPLLGAVVVAGTKHKHRQLLLQQQQQQQQQTKKVQQLRIRRRQKSSLVMVNKIVGLPNQGQTCFLNSVLQSMASLPYFIEYLEQITMKQDEMMLCNNDVDDVDDEQQQDKLLSRSLSSSPSFSRQLLTLLYGINSVNDDDDDGNYGDNHQNIHNNNHNLWQGIFQHRGGSRGRIRRRRNSNINRLNPKALLKRIGKNNAQFKVSASSSVSDQQQQDAQELLEALMETVIEDGQFDHGSSNNINADTTTRSSWGKSNDGGEKSTTASGSSSDRSVIAKTSGLATLDLITEVVRVNQYSALSAHNTDESTSLVQQEPHNQTEAKTNGDDSGATIEETPRENQLSDHLKLPFTQPLENGQLSGDVRLQKAKIGSIENLSLSSSDPYDNIANVVSSTTPSPLSGWLGSSVRCCACKRDPLVRLFPFTDIPLTPTSIPDFMGQMYNPSKPIPPSDPRVQPCTLDQCLLDFTSIERVRDVECRYCTIQRERKECEEEIAFYSECLEHTEKTDVNTDHSSKHLAKYKERLEQLNKMDPDDEDDECLATGHPTEFEGSSDDFKLEVFKMKRNDAEKCLQISRPPQILCCHIQRRYYNPFTDRMDKCVQAVQFPEFLDLAPYCISRWTNTVGSVPPKDTPGGSARKRSLMYRLCSVVEHLGTAYHGHYVAYRKDSKGDWYQISDNRVTPITWQHVECCKAYMLFYEKLG